jgi:hypothetical protein
MSSIFMTVTSKKKSAVEKTLYVEIRTHARPQYGLHSAPATQGHEGNLGAAW